MPIKPHRQGQHWSRFQPAFTGAVERTKPAEVAFQVRRGDTLDPSEPGFEPAVIRVGVLAVPGAAHAVTGAQVISLVLDAQFFGRRRHGRRAVRAQHGIALDTRLERLAQTPEFDTNRSNRHDFARRCQLNQRLSALVQK